MKELSEYKQMILQRSEEKQRKRNRVKLIACCIPLAICITAAAAWSQLPRSVSKDAAPGAGKTNGTLLPENGSAMGDQMLSCTVQITCGDLAAVTVFERSEYQYLSQLIMSAFVSNECISETKPQASTTETLPSEYLTGSTIPKYCTENFDAELHPEYTISFTDAYGEKTIYFLFDQHLTNTLTGETVKLDAYALKELKNALDALL